MLGECDGEIVDLGLSTHAADSMDMVVAEVAARELADLGVELVAMLAGQLCLFLLVFLRSGR